MNSKKSGKYFPQALKSFISFMLILSMVITPGLLPTVSKAEEETGQENKYLTAEDILENYIAATGGPLEQTQDYKFDYSEPAPTYGQLSNVKFIQTASGKLGGHALDSEGKVWSWGYNIAGRTGIGKTEGEQNYLGGMMQIPYFVDKGIKIKKIAAGYETGYALSEGGDVYAWGRGTEGQMGAGFNRLINPTPIKVEIDKKIVDFYPAKANQAHHIAAVDVDGDIWMWGYADNGRIPGEAGYVNIPVMVSKPKGVKFTKVSPGDNYTLALADDGTVWSMGNRVYGALGDGKTSGITTEFNKIETLSNIIDIDSSYSRNLALDGDGIVYEWGQIFGKPDRNISIPEKIKIAKEDVGNKYDPIAKKIAAGESVSFFIDQHGRSWAWGYSRYFGQAREGGYETANDIRTNEARLYPRIIGDGDTQIYDKDAK